MPETVPSLGIGEAVALGVLQGLTEFLPISSSGHLALAQHFLGLRDLPLFFDVMLHVGTLAAVLFFYRRSLLMAVGDAAGVSYDQSAVEAMLLPRLPGWRTAWLLILATLPVVMASFVFRVETADGPSETPAWIEQIAGLREHASERPWAILGFMVATGGVLLIGSRFQGGKADAEATTWWQAVIVGIAQTFSALFPGISRSGATVSTGLVAGMRPEWAVHFSLLMSIPAILGAAVLKAADLDPRWLTPGNIVATLIGTLVSAMVGWCCILFLLHAVRRRRWWWFTIYLWSFALIVAGILSAQSAGS
ncbi:Undecaprenyl-diphosphatase [Planctomycetes bacterium Pan216]|uniref:Undecaprenyl-diphosphatase n=1 Tax=Kolteria novifilia TaxID=2527975 RepID=A0A518B9M6_9BACT|nr:Undecaprenyl-diphosphatase [Planctomycetes bacterium Pan216]